MGVKILSDSLAKERNRGSDQLTQALERGLSPRPYCGPAARQAAPLCSSKLLLLCCVLCCSKLLHCLPACLGFQPRGQPAASGCCAGSCSQAPPAAGDRAASPGATAIARGQATVGVTKCVCVQGNARTRCACSRLLGPGQTRLFVQETS